MLQHLHKKILQLNRQLNKKNKNEPLKAIKHGSCNFTIKKLANRS